MGIGLSLAALVCCVVVLAVTAVLARRFELATRTSVAGACFWGVVLCVWDVYAMSGLVDCSTPWWAFAVMLLVALVAATTLAGPGLRARMSPVAGRVARVALVVLGVFVGFFLLEWPYNASLFGMDPASVLLNLGILLGALLAVWFCCQRHRFGAMLFVVACITFGLANYFLCLFKEQVVLPADVLALGTAAEVSAGYSFMVGDAAVQALCVFCAYLALANLVPTPRVTRRGVAVNLVVGLACAAVLVGWYATHDLKRDFGVTVDVWSTRESYMARGSVPCFLQRMQEIDPKVPAGYSTSSAAALQDDLAARWDAAHPGYPQTLEESAAYRQAQTGDSELPSVVVIMNESFSDLSMYPGVEGYPGTVSYDAVDTSLRGLVYTSVRGGGTCNSEFEYLVGSTLGSLGGGVYPYMFYDLSGAEALPAYFSAMGYDTTAIHPEAATNWRRDVVYQQIGFDRFLSDEAFGPNAPELRGLVTDRATYDMVFEVLASSDAPQFVFDVTLQNHGGYDTGQLDEYRYAGVTVNGTVVEGMDEYLGCIDASQEDLAYLLDGLAGLDRRVVVVFFGDHQPGFNDAVSEAAYGTSVDDLTHEQVQQRFVAPYFIWANYDLGEGVSAVGVDGELDMSLGYLMAQTAYAAGLPLTPYQKALLQIQEEMPAVNLNGYMDADGQWYWIGQDGPAAQAYADYETLQYANLFDPAGNAAFDDFAVDTQAEQGVR